MKLTYRKKLSKFVHDLFINLFIFCWALDLNIYVVRFCKQLDTWGMDGEVQQVILPSEEEVSKLVSTSEKQSKERLGMCLLKFFNWLVYNHFLKWYLCLFYAKIPIHLIILFSADAIFYIAIQCLLVCLSLQTSLL